MTTTFFQLATGDFSQNWSDASLITANDDWSGVPSIQGYRGDGLTGSTGTDPRTILSDGSGTPVDVIANQSSTTLTTGGIAEFDGIGNPVVALQASGTADAPHLVFHIDATGRTNIQFDALLRDLDADTAVQPVAFQYRIGTTGDYTNIDSAFVADANNGGTTAISFVLPADAEGQSQVQIRAMTTNAAGSDTFIGVDDIVISSDAGVPAIFAYNFNDFAGSGFAPAPVAGQFDSDDYIVAGLSDGSLVFGDTGTTGDFARGLTDGTGETTGGVYALDRDFGDMAVWFQPSGSDLTPGEFTVRITNTGAASDSFSLAYDLLVLNDQARANSFDVSVSTDNATYVSVPALDYTSPEAADASGVHEFAQFAYFTLDSVVANGGAFFVRFDMSDASGSGARDEFGIDNLVVRFAEARSLIVTTDMDVVDDTDGLTSLREAIAFANDPAAGAMGDGDADDDTLSNDTITFASGMGDAFEGGGTIYLTADSQLEITSDVTIEGDLDDDGEPDIIVDANSAMGMDDAANRVLAVVSGTTTVDGLSIVGGYSDYGGGVRVYSGATLALNNSTVSGNYATDDGGGIFSLGTLTLTDSTVSGNDAAYFGGGIFSDGTATLTNSLVNQNTSDNSGGGLFNADELTLLNSTVADNDSITANGGGIYNSGASAVLVLTGSTVSENTASNGGGISDFAGTATLKSSTVSGNTASFSGGGISTHSSSSVTLYNTTVSNNDGAGLGGGIAGPVTLVNSTVSGNAATFRGGGIYNFTDTATITNSIILGNYAPNSPEIHGAVDDSGGPNITSGSPVDVFAAIDGASLSGVGGLLADNGGPVETIALLYSATNPAIDSGDIAAPGAPLTDARGLGRVDWPLVGNDGMSFLDLGAFEVQGSETPSLHVTITGDIIDGFDGETSLREAIAFANFVGDADGVNGSVDTITFAAGVGDAFETGGTITLTMGELEITSDVTIAGDVDSDDTPDVTIDAGGANRALLVESESTVAVDGLILTNGSESEGGAVHVAEDASFTFTDGEISDNDAPSYGGGLYANNGATVYIENSLITDNDSNDYGGGIYLDGATLTVHNSTISGNYAADQGGGIQAIDGSSITITDSLIHDNTAMGQTGGGIDLLSGSSATITDSTVSQNMAGSDGGGIYVDSDATLTVTGASIRQNNAELTGGGIYNKGTATLTDTSVNDNSVNAGSAGGIYNYSGGTLTVTDSTVSENGSFGPGGGIVNLGGATLTNVTVDSNSVYSGGGGGIYNRLGATLTLTNATISNHSVSDYGGGILSVDAMVTAVNTTISGNYAAMQGGGFYGFNGSADFTNTIILGNSASGGGAEAAGTYSDSYSTIGGTPANVFATIDPTSPSGIGGLLADNGGPIETIALLTDVNNPALDAGDDGAAPALDARGEARFDQIGLANNGANISDLGAFELQDQANFTPSAPLLNAVTTDEDTPSDPVSIGASDGDGDDLMFSIKPTAAPDKGTVNFFADGSFIYTPDPDVNGEDSFTILIDDGDGGLATQVVSVTINPVEDTPIAEDDMVMTVQDSPLALNPLTLIGNDHDSDGDALLIAALMNASGGSVAQIDGNIVFTPAPGFVGTAGFDYMVTDGNGNFDTAHVTVDVAPLLDVPNQAPELNLVNANLTTFINAPVSGLAMAVDPEDDPVTFGAQGAAHGDVTIGADGAFIYTPDEGYFGTDSFIFTAADDQDNESMQLVSVTIVDINAAADWLLLTTEGFAGSIGGNGDVFAAPDVQHITVLDRPGIINFKPGFNAGGDIVRLPGEAADWSTAQAGANGVFTDGDTFAILPGGPDGATIVFDDGARLFAIDGSDLRIGEQTLTDSVTPVDTPFDGTLLPPAPDPDATGQLILFPGADVTAAGDIEIIGTNGLETVTFLGGDATFDPSFNRGGDTVAFDDPAADFTAMRSGSDIFISGTDTTAQIPFGTGELFVSFDGDDRTLSYDVGTDVLTLGDDIITGAATPLSFA